MTGGCYICGKKDPELAKNNDKLYAIPTKREGHSMLMCGWDHAFMLRLCRLPVDGKLFGGGFVKKEPDYRYDPYGTSV